MTMRKLKKKHCTQSQILTCCELPGKHLHLVSYIIFKYGVWNQTSGILEKGNILGENFRINSLSFLFIHCPEHIGIHRCT